MPEATTAQDTGDAAAAAGAASGGGSGGGANAAAAIVQAAEGILDGITAAAQIGTAQQAQPDIMAKRHSTRFQNMLTGIRRLDAEVVELHQRRTEAIAWLQGAPKKQWMTGAAAMAVAPAGQRSCPPLYEGAPGGVTRNPGGHAYGDPTCRCPTSPCAFRDPLGAADRQARVADINRRLVAIVSTRDAGNEDFYGSKNRGNYRTYRTQALRSYGFLLTLRGYEPLLRYSPLGAAAVSWAPSDSVLFAPATLRALFPDDPDAQRGIVPALDRSRILGDWLNTAAVFPALAALRPPTWIYGLTPEERARVEVGPPIGLLLELANAPGNVGGGTNRISDGVKQLLLGDPAQAEALIAQYLTRAPLLPPPAPHIIERALVWLEQHWVSAALVTTGAAIVSMFGRQR